MGADREDDLEEPEEEHELEGSRVVDVVVGRDEAQYGQEGQAEDGEGVRAWRFTASPVEGQVEVG